MKNTRKVTTNSINEVEVPRTSTPNSKQTSCEEENNDGISITSNDENKESNQDAKTTLTSNQVFNEQTNTHSEINSLQLQIHMGKSKQELEISETKVVEDCLKEIATTSCQSNILTTEEDNNAHANSQDATSLIMSWPRWEEQEQLEINDDHEKESDLQQFEANLDWINDISRPRTYWEDRRQARYEEIFNTCSKKEEIRQLIERGNVSSILASDFRDRMDRLMMCTIQRLMHSSEKMEVEEEEQFMGGLYSNTQHEENQRCTQEYTSEEHNFVEENKEENEDGDEEKDVSDNEQTSSSSQLLWDPYHEDQPSEDDSDHVTSTFLPKPSPNHSYYSQTNEGSSFKNNSSIEVELIYDLRENMQQLYQEMFALRKSITNCMDMQVKLQNSIKEEVALAINQIDEEQQNKSNGRHKKKGSCCICNEKTIDTLLYRCGHMCTCFNCATELRRNIGKCPVCRSQIIDVVRTYHDK